MKTPNNKEQIQPIPPSLVDTFELFLQASGKRVTRERLAVAQYINDCEKSFDVQQVLVEVEKAGLRLSQATVYNTLQLLEDAGLIRRLTVGGQTSSSYELVSRTSLFYLICSRCGSVTKQKASASFSQSVTAIRYGSFKPDYFNLYVYGICGKCSRAAKKAKKIIINSSSSNEKGRRAPGSAMGRRRKG